MRKRKIGNKIKKNNVVHAGHSNVNRFYASGDCVEHSSHNSHGSHSSHGQW